MKFNQYVDQSESVGTYIKWEEGENIIRIVSECEIVWKAFKDNKCVAEFMTKAGADKFNETNPDALTDDKCRANPKTAFYAINRSTGKIQIIEVGPMIANQIAELATKADYAFEDIPPYDMIITKTISGKKTLYSVLGFRNNTSLTDEEIALIVNLEPLVKVLAKNAKDV